MKPRDRLVVCVLVAAAVLAAIWLGVVSPKRDNASRLGTALTVAQARLGTAQSQLGQAKAAEAGYANNLQVVKSLYRAVPADDGVPRLLVSLDRTSQYKRVDFKVVSVAAPAAAAGPSGTPAVAAGGLSPTSFTFTFHGGYVDLQHFLRTVNSYTLLKGSTVVAHGRLLTIQSVALTHPQGAPVTTQAAVTATAYSQPGAGVPAAAGATSTASAPAGPATTSAATVAASTTPTR